MRKRGVIAYFLLLAIAAVVAAVLVARFITTDSQTKTISPEPLKTRDADSSASEMPPIVKIEPPILESEIIAPPVTTTKPQSIDAPPASIPEPELPAKKPPDPRITSSNSVTTSQIDIEAIVLVRCRFENQYFKTSNQPWGEERFSLGSGIIISEAGYILSVKHLFEFEKEKNDLSDRKWIRTDCAAAQTTRDQTPIHPTNPNDSPNDPEFKNVSIIFEPTSKEYNQANDLDFIILKAAGLRPSYHKLEPHLIGFEKDDKIIAVGYPGKIVSTPQTLERWDGGYQTLASLEGSSCSGELTPCGLRYMATRLLKEYRDLFYKESPLGIYSPYFRGGFSGAPAFYNGNLIGIITHGESGDKNPEEQDEVLILTSFDISETLKKHDVSL